MKCLHAEKDMKLACKEDKLINDIVELYSHNFFKARAIDRENPENEYAAGRVDGAVEALSMIMLVAIGGKRFYKFWEKTIAWAKKEVEKERENDSEH